MLNQYIIFLVVFLFTINSSISQDINMDLIWEKTYGGSSRDILYSVQPNGDQGYIIGGYTLSGQSGDISTPSYGSSDFWVVDIDSMGQVIWDKRYGMIGSESLNEIVPLVDGGFILGGRTNMITTTEINERAGVENFLVYRVSEDGEVIWQKMLGGNEDDELQSIVLTQDGGILVGGRVNSVDGDVQSRSANEFEYWDFDFWVVKLNMDGEIVWENSYGKHDSWDGLWHILPIADGYLLGGSTARDKNGNSTSLNGPKNMSLIKIDFDGNFVWEKIYGGSDYDYLTQIIQSNDGGYLLVGETESIDGDVQSRKDKDIIASDDKDCWVVKVDINGDFMWEQYFGGFSFEVTFSASKMNNGDYTIVGGTRSNELNGLDQGGFDFWVFKIDDFGKIIWDKSFGGSETESCTSLFQINDKEYLLGGYTKSNDGDVQSSPNGSEDYWVVRAGDWVNQKPTIDNQSFNINENAENGKTIGLVQANDPDGHDLKFSITSGNDLRAFQIDLNTGEITVSDSTLLDFETSPSFELSIDVSDGELSDMATITVNLDEVNEAPTADDTTFTVDENSPAGTKVGTFAASDPEDDDLTFSITSGNDLGTFQVDQNSGEITVADSDPLDFETNPAFILTIEANDGELIDEATISVDLNDLDDDVLGIADQFGNKVRLYPNPAREFVTVVWDNFERAAISELSGKELFKSDTRTLDLRTLNAGVYLITLKGTNNERITFRIIKE